MSTISVTNINDGDAVTAASVNNQVNTIVNDYNGNITDANIATGAAIGAQKIAGGVSGMFGTWQSFTPTFVNLTVGNGTLVAKYIQIGKTVHCRVSFILGSTSSVSGDVTVTHPVTSVTLAGLSSVQPLGLAHFYDNGASILTGLVSWASTTTAFIRANNISANSNKLIALSSGVPFAWASTYQFAIQYTYEAA